MKRLLILLFIAALSPTAVLAQSQPTDSDAAKIIQPAESFTQPDSVSAAQAGAAMVPAGTLIEVEVAYTVNSLDVKAGEHISFRVVVPVVVDGVTLIERDALVTARVIKAKRGGHWGKAGKLVWAMEDVVAADLSRVPLRPETLIRTDKIWSLENKSKTPDAKGNYGRISGTSHAGQVATMSVISGVLFPPMALMGVFKRGENAILREGRRYVVTVGKDSSVKPVSNKSQTE